MVIPMCNLNELLGHNDYCATGCPKCNPTGENSYGYLINAFDHDKGEDIKNKQMCVDCGFMIDDKDVNCFSNRRLENPITEYPRGNQK